MAPALGQQATAATQRVGTTGARNDHPLISRIEQQSAAARQAPAEFASFLEEDDSQNEEQVVVDPEDDVEERWF